MAASVEKLIAARELIARPGGWTKNRSGSNERGGCCALIATIRAGGGPHELECLYKSIGVEDITPWNNARGRKKADIIAAYDRAIELARAAS